MLHQALIRKLFRSLGIPLWCDLSMLDTGCRHPRIYLYVCTTDCGPDQAACRRTVAATIRTMEHVGFISIDCQPHQVQLIAGHGLHVVTYCLKHAGITWNYDSSLYKLTHVWRSESRGIYAAWKHAHGAAAAEQFAAVLPPKCISGRWLSVSNTERFMVKVADDAPGVIRSVLMKHTPASAQDEVDVQSGKADADSMVFHKVKLGRWRRDVLDVIDDKRFWAVAEASLRARADIDHIHAFLQEELQDTDTKGYHLRRLVCGRADAVIEGIQKELHDDTQWWATRAALLDECDQAWYVHMGAALLLSYGASFHRRCRKFMCEYPARLLLMLQSPADVACQQRSGIAKELLDSLRGGLPSERTDNMDATTLKIAYLYKDLLLVALDHGLLPAELAELLVVIDESAKVSVQEVEGINSMVGEIARRAPHISLELLSARITLKKALVYKNLRQRWKLVQPRVETLFGALGDAAQRGDAPHIDTSECPVLEDDRLMRWKAPAPIMDCPSAAALNQVAREEQRSRGIIVNTPLHILAAPWALQWMRTSSNILATEALILDTGPSAAVGSTVFVCVERHKYRGTLMPWLVSSDGIIEMVSPVDFQSSLDIFAAHVPHSGTRKDSVKVHIAPMIFDCGALTKASIHRGRLAFTMTKRKPKPRQRSTTSAAGARQSAMDLLNQSEAIAIDEVDESTVGEVVRIMVAEDDGSTLEAAIR